MRHLFAIAGWGLMAMGGAAPLMRWLTQGEDQPDVRTAAHRCLVVGLLYLILSCVWSRESPRGAAPLGQQND